MRCQDRFGMELNPPERKILMAEAHDLTLGSLCRDLEAVGKTLPADKEAMVSGGLERIG